MGAILLIDRLHIGLFSFHADRSEPDRRTVVRGLYECIEWNKSYSVELHMAGFRDGHMGSRVRRKSRGRANSSSHAFNRWRKSHALRRRGAAKLNSGFLFGAGWLIFKIPIFKILFKIPDILFKILFKIPDKK